MTDWDESEHPRDPDGRFTEKSWYDWAADVREQFPGVALDLSQSATRPDLVTLSRIIIPVHGPFGQVKRGEGVGTQIMEMIAEEADRRGQTIALTPGTDWGATSKARLERFYRRFGFVSNLGPSRDYTITDSMIRRPLSQTGDPKAKTWVERVAERLPGGPD